MGRGEGGDDWAEADGDRTKGARRKARGPSFMETTPGTGVSANTKAEV